MKFNTESTFFRMLGLFGKFACLNIVFVITCIPVITIGQSVTALYSAIFKYAVDEDDCLTTNFFKAYKDSFVSNTIYYLLSLAFTAVLTFSLYFWYKLNNGWNWIVVGLFAIASLAFLFMLFYLFPLLAHYTARGKQVIQNAFLLALANFRITLALLAINIACLALVLLAPSFRAVFAIFGIAFEVYCKSLLLIRAFNRYANW